MYRSGFSPPEFDYQDFPVYMLNPSPPHDAFLEPLEEPLIFINPPALFEVNPDPPSQQDAGEHWYAAAIRSMSPPPLQGEDMLGMTDYQKKRQRRLRYQALMSQLEESKNAQIAADQVRQRALSNPSPRSAQEMQQAQQEIVYYASKVRQLETQLDELGFKARRPLDYSYTKKEVRYPSKQRWKYR